MSQHQLTEKRHIRELGAGDYAIVESHHWPIVESVVLCCPICGALMHCTHEIVSKSPLTLRPSVVGPGSGPAMLGPCGHHMMIENGKADVF